MEVVEKDKYKRSEVGLIPENWVTKKIDEIASITTGNKDTQDRVEEGKYPFFVRSNIIERINTFSFDGEAVLTSGDGVGVGKIYHYIDGKFDFHQRVYSIHYFNSDISGLYFYYQFSTNFNNRVMSMTAKSSVDSVRREMISQMQIALPPTLEEQKAIAKALSDVDELIQCLDKLIAKKKAIKEGAMQRLLTPPNKGGQRLPGFEGDWEEKKLGEVFELKQGLQKSVNDQELHKKDGYVRFIRIIDLTNQNEKPRYIKIPDQSHLISKNDLFMVRYGTPGLLGFGYEGVIANNLFRLKPKQKLIEQYFFHYLSFNNEEILNLSSSTTMAALSFSSLKALEISYPSDIKNQQAIGQILSEMDKEIESLEKKQAKYEQIKEGMMQELLTGKTRLV